MQITQEKNTYPFLQGGGEMGEHIRSFKWSKSSIGTPDRWPQALQISVSNILNSGFPMFLFWGDDLTCFYNDAFRPSLGVDGKHSAIGKKGKDVWSEIWDFIGPLINGVLDTGKPVWFENQLVPFYRNGRLEDIYWTFSYSLILSDDGQAGGVLVTCMETTDAVQAQKRVQESEARFRMLFKTMDQGFSIIEMIFDEKGKAVDSLFLEMNSVFEQQSGFKGAVGKRIREIVSDIEEKWFEVYGKVALSGEAVRFMDKSEALGKWFDIYAFPAGDLGSRKVAVLFTDITEQTLSRKRIEESEARFRNIIEQAPVAIGLTRGENFIFESINTPMLQLINKKDKQDVLGKTLAEVLPELVSQPVYTILNNVLQKGEDFYGAEIEADLVKEGVLQRRYFNITYKRLFDTYGLPSVLHMAADITEHVMARRKTEESEAKLRSILNSLPTAMGVFVGPDLIVENPNQLMIEVMAAGPDIEGKSFRKLLSGLVEEDQKFIGLIDRVRSTGQPFEAQEVMVFFKEAKQTRYFNINFIPLRDEDAEVYAVLDVSVEVTEQVLARKKVEQSETKFRLLIEEAPFPTALYTGPELTIDTINEAMLHLWNKPASVVGKTFEQALPEMDGQPFTELLKNVYHTGVEYIAKDQAADIIVEGQVQRGWYNFSYKPIRNEEGNVYGILHMAVDVTEQVMARQKLEEKETALEAALEQVRLSKEAAELGTFDMNLEKGTLHWDDRCRILFGISHRQPVTYEKDFVGGLHHDDRERIIKVIQNCFIKSVSNGDYDVEYRTVGAEDGVQRWVRAKGKVYFNSDDKPVRFVGSVLDITPQVDALHRIESLVTQRTKELAAVNDSLSALNKELQRSNANLEEFAHAASHDLKEPIRKIHFFTNQLKEQFGSQLKEAEIRSFTRIENATVRMGNLIDDLLLYSHVSQRPHETGPVDLNEKVQRVLEDLELDIAEKTAVIHVGKLPTVQGYGRQLQQLFQNLVSNAIKYSKADVPPQITITAEPSEKNGRLYHAIKISDNGIGFQQQYEDKIFQMFFRLHGKSEYGGTGVGLSIAKKVVENHNGFITVQSTLGEGSTFVIYLLG